MNVSPLNDKSTCYEPLVSFLIGLLFILSYDWVYSYLAVRTKYWFFLTLFSYHETNPAFQMSCRNYIGYKLQLPVARSASEGVFSGCSFIPETNNDSTGQSTIQYCMFSFLPRSFLCFILDLKKKNLFTLLIIVLPILLQYVLYFKLSFVFKLLFLIFWLDCNVVKIFQNIFRLCLKAEKSRCQMTYSLWGSVVVLVQFSVDIFWYLAIYPEVSVNQHCYWQN